VSVVAAKRMIWSSLTLMLFGLLYCCEALLLVLKADFDSDDVDGVVVVVVVDDDVGDVVLVQSKKLLSFQVRICGTHSTV